MLEVQIAQEYTGQQRHVCYLIPMFREILAFRTYAAKENDAVGDIVSGKTFGQRNCGMAAVANTGNDANWTGHDLAAANWYGFGRLAFEPELSAEEIAREWIRLTYGKEKDVEETLLYILMASWQVYEKYTSPLGIKRNMRESGAIRSILIFTGNRGFPMRRGEKYIEYKYHKKYYVIAYTYLHPK